MEDNFETRTEHELAEIWAEVLKIDKVRRDENFFNLGGDSLLATKVVLAARRRWQIKFTVRVLIDKPVLADLAEHIDRWAHQNAGTHAP